MNKILVTGAAGFIGSFLVKALVKRKENITALVRKTSDPKAVKELQGLGANVVIGDLCDKESLEKAVKGMEAVIHCAAVHNENYEDLKSNNVDGTKNLLDICLKNNVKRFIHISSAVVFGKIKDGTEESKCNPESPYAKSKYEGELIVKEYIGKGIAATILRPPIVYGPHPRANMIQWLRYIKKGHFMIFGNGTNNIEVVHVDDVAQGVILALNNKKSINQTYIISSPTITMNEFINLIARIEGVKKPRHIPIWFANLLAIGFALLSKITKHKPPLTRIKIKNMTRDRSLSIRKAKEELGYEPKITVEEGLTGMIKWCTEKGYF